MSRKTQAISDEFVKQCRRELKEQGIRGETGRRLQAIISAKEHGILAVSKIYNISRETLMRWIRKFKAEGSKGFEVAPGRGRPSALSIEQKLEMQKYIATEGATLTSKKLQFEIEKRFHIKYSPASAHRLLKELGFSFITPRPSHYKQDKMTQEQFKKKSTRTGRKRT